MENDGDSESPKQGSSDQAVPSLIEFISAKNVDGFDTTTPFRPSRFRPLHVETGSIAEETPPMSHQREHSVSISMPSSPFMTNTGIFSPEAGKVTEKGISESVHTLEKQVKIHSQPMPKGAHLVVVTATANIQKHPSARRLKKDNIFNSLKTWSRKLEHQFSTLRGKPHKHGSEERNAIITANEPVGTKSLMKD